MADTTLPLPASFVGRIVPFWGDAAVLVSGGSDSVALARMVVQCRIGAWRRLRILHFDHRLRPDSAGDATFVCELAEQLGVPCDVVRLDPEALQSAAGGLQAAARGMRRAHALRYLAQHNLSWMLLGHTSDDHLETIVSQMLRGRGVQDRRGILPAYGPVLRPAIALSRVELQRWLMSIKQPWRTDSSNDQDHYQRNYLRLQTLPELELRGAIPHLVSYAQHAGHLWHRAHAQLMQMTGASPTTALVCRMPAADELLGTCICALWAGYREVQVSQAQWKRLWHGSTVCQIDVHGGRLCRMGDWFWMVRPQDLLRINQAVTQWLALDKRGDVPILSSGMGYPTAARFEFARRSVSAQDAFRRAAIPAFLRPQIGWKVLPHGIQFLPAPQDGLTAVHLLP